jgi:CheY-like chemotaxis protein
VLAKTENQKTILVVEDDVLVRMPISQYLRDCGYRVIEAVNADEAMAVLLHRETPIDLVFSDIEMPGSIDGFWAGEVDTRKPPWLGCDPDGNPSAHRRLRQRAMRAGAYTKAI